MWNAINGALKGEKVKWLIFNGNTGSFWLLEIEGNIISYGCKSYGNGEIMECLGVLKVIC